MQYSIKGIRSGQKISVLTIEAADRQAAIENAARQGFRVISAKSASLWSVNISRRKRFDNALFSQELLALLNAGLTVVDALETLRDKEDAAPSKRVIEQLLTEVNAGRTLSYAASRIPEAFPELFVASVKATEQSGDLPRALARYIAYRKQVDGVKKRVITASIYPAILIIVGIAVIAFLIFYVVPRFARVYQDLSGHLPYFASVLMGVGKTVDDHAVAVLVATAVIISAIVATVLDPRVRISLLRHVRRMPSLGIRFQIYSLSRLYRSLSMLLQAGIPITQAASMVGGLLNSDLRSNLDHAERQMREGQPISSAMRTAGLTTAISARLLAVGERTGSMGDMMEKIADIYDESLSRWVDAFTRIFEPLLMAGIGIVVGAIVVLMYMPIFELASTLQ